MQGTSLTSWAVGIAAGTAGVIVFTKALRGLASVSESIQKLRGSPKPVPTSAAAAAPKPAAAKPRYSFNNSTGQWDLKGAPSAAAGAATRMLKGGLPSALRWLGEKSMTSLFDGIDSKLGLNTSGRPDPEMVATIQRLMGSKHQDPSVFSLIQRLTSTKATSGANVDQGQYERSRRIDDEFRRNPEGARGRAMMRSGQGGDAEQRVKLANADLAAIINPKGTQDVRVINPPPAPTVNVSVTVNATTGASAGQIGSEVGKAVGAQTKRAIEGAFSDAAN